MKQSNRWIVWSLLAAAGLGFACSRDEASQPMEVSSSVVVYSGRNESLIGPLLEKFEEQSGVEVEVRYGETAEMAATLLEEGTNSPADLFISQDAAALGAVAAAGLLGPLPASILERVPARFRSSDGNWVGLSGRVRSVVYNPTLVSEDDLPRSLEAVADPKYLGRFGIAPANGSLQAHLAVYQVVNGPQALETLLAGIAANKPGTYPKNSAIVQAVIAGEVEWGLVNHYYLLRALAEEPDAPGRNFFMSEGEASGFVNVAGAGRLSSSPRALELLEFLLSDDSQAYFAEETYEYPLVPGVPAAASLVPIEELATPEVDFGQVSDALEATLSAINASGLMQ